MTGCRKVLPGLHGHPASKGSTCCRKVHTLHTIHMLPKGATRTGGKMGVADKPSGLRRQRMARRSRSRSTQLEDEAAIATLVAVVRRGGQSTGSGLAAEEETVEPNLLQTMMVMMLMFFFVFFCDRENVDWSRAGSNSALQFSPVDNPRA